jgi:hypothetical protein
MVCSGTILEFIISKEGKASDFFLKKTLVKMLVPKTL